MWRILIDCRRDYVVVVVVVVRDMMVLLLRGDRHWHGRCVHQIERVADKGHRRRRWLWKG